MYVNFMCVKFLKTQICPKKFQLICLKSVQSCPASHDLLELYNLKFKKKVYKFKIHTLSLQVSF